MCTPALLLVLARGGMEEGEGGGMLIVESSVSFCTHNLNYECVDD